VTATLSPPTALRDDAYAALDVVLDPELDEPITDLGFVRSLEVVDADVVVHLRLPTSFCSPNFAYLMASDAKDALTALPWTGRVVVELDDHHDSDIINRGLAADAGLPRHLPARGRARPRGAAGDLPPQGAHRRDGAVPDRAAAREPDRPLERSAGRPGRPAGRAAHRRPAAPPRRRRAARRAGRPRHGRSRGHRLRPAGRPHGAAPGAVHPDLRSTATPTSAAGSCAPATPAPQTEQAPRADGAEPADLPFPSLPTPEESPDEHDARRPGRRLPPGPADDRGAGPEVTGPFDVLVRIGGAGVCRTDLHILEGQWAEKSQVALPYTIGHENAGWVHAVGAAVTNVAEGDKVIVHPL
jgi:metal-sulfur cluster biosynthetic enzyme